MRDMISIQGKVLGHFLLASSIMLFDGCIQRNNDKLAALSSSQINQILDDYRSALSTGDSNAVKPFWSRLSLARRGFWTMHNYFFPWGTFAEWPTRAAGSRFEIQDIDQGRKYYALSIRWLPQDTSTAQIRNLKFHVLQEDNRWVFIHPIDLLTVEWKTYQTEDIEFHYPPEIEINNYLDEILYTEQEFSKALEIFELTVTRKIDFYKARTDVECGQLMNFGPVNGYVLMPNTAENTFGHDVWLVASSSFVNHHEFIHVITGLLGIPFDNPAVTEGLACAFAGGFHTTPGFMIIDARNQIVQSLNFPLKELLTMNGRTFNSNNYIVYSQAGSFMKYLYDRYGMNKLKELCSMQLTGDKIIASIESNYHKPVDQLEKEWIAHLLGNETPEIGTTIPSDAKQIFSLSDAEGDDTGDGDYEYPAHDNYPKGSFDLRKFEVLSDKIHTYFRIEYTTLKKPLVLGLENRGEKFAVGCVIAIQKGGGMKRHLQKLCHGVRFFGDDGYDVKVNVGTNVSLTNCFGEIFFSSPEIADKIFHYDNHTIEFSVPSSLIGEPDADWKYFVGTCLVSNRIMNFLGEPLRVYKKRPAPIFISGGNYDYGNPAFMDILLPSGVNQIKLLSDYAADMDKIAVVPMIGQKGISK